MRKVDGSIVACVVIAILLMAPWGRIRKLITEAVTGVVYISDISEQEASQDIGSMQKNKSFSGKVICLNAKKYSRGISTHANSEVVYNLNSKYEYFESDIGIDDNEDPGPDSAIFKVFVDDEKAYESPIMRWDSATVHIKIDVKNKQQLRLVATDAGDGIDNDEAVWADAKLRR